MCVLQGGAAEAAGGGALPEAARRGQDGGGAVGPRATRARAETARRGGAAPRGGVERSVLRHC